MEVKAYAKINLTLEVLGRRPDGYHEVRTVLQTVQLADTLCFTPSDRLEMDCSVPELGGQDNLVLKAAEALSRATGCGDGIKVYLDKHIPIGVGLGGGSSDAAATLKALDGLWGLGLTDEKLRSIAESLGSDVPFFIRGGTALGKGRGEIITELPPMPNRWIVLLCPLPGFAGTGASFPKTAHLYSMLGPEHYTDGSHTCRAVDAIKSGCFSRALLYNAFERVAPAAFEGFEGARRDFLESGARGVYLSGAGPSLYTFVSCKEEGEGISKSLKRKGLKAYCVSTFSPNK